MRVRVCRTSSHAAADADRRSVKWLTHDVHAVRLTQQPGSNHVADGLHRDGVHGTPKDVLKLVDGRTRDFAE